MTAAAETRHTDKTLEALFARREELRKQRHRPGKAEIAEINDAIEERSFEYPNDYL